MPLSMKAIQLAGLPFCLGAAGPLLGTDTFLAETLPLTVIISPIRFGPE